MRVQVTKRCRLKERRAALLLGGLLAIAGLNAVAAPASPAQAPAGTDNGELRFAVAHQHFGGWCYGYLYVAAGQLRYEVDHPQSDQGHSFTADWSDVVAGPRLFLGQPNQALKDFINIKVKHQSYNFLWLANEAEVKSGGPHRMAPPQGAPPDTLLAALQSAAAAPSAGMKKASSRAAASASSSELGQAPAPAQEIEVPEGDVRFAVAHQHKDSSWCYGYLYVTSDQLRYEVVQPASDRPHGFALDRSLVTAHNAAPDAFQVVLAGEKYRFRWLANEDDVNKASARPDNLPEAASPEIVIKKIQSPTAKTPEGASLRAKGSPAR